MKLSIILLVYFIQTVFSDVSKTTVKNAGDTGSQRKGVLVEVNDGKTSKSGLFIGFGSYIIIGNKVKSVGGVIGLDGPVCEDGTTSCDIKFSFKANGEEVLEMQIKTSKLNSRTQYWEVEEINLTYDKKTTSFDINGLTAPKDYSFSCNSLELTPKSTENNIQKLVIKNFQIQPFGSNNYFNESYDCSSWFTIGSFMGLIIVSMFTSVLAFGICFILNIKSNDRFEDPKGKPLVLGSIDG